MVCLVPRSVLQKMKQTLFGTDHRREHEHCEGVIGSISVVESALAKLQENTTSLYNLWSSFETEINKLPEDLGRAESSSRFKKAKFIWDNASSALWSRYRAVSIRKEVVFCMPDVWLPVKLIQ